MVFNITEHVQGVQYLLRFWRSDGVLNLNTQFYSVVFDLFCIFRENTHEQQLIQAKIFFPMPLSKHFRFCLWWESFFNGSHFSTCQTRKKSTPVTFFLHMRHVFLRPGVISLRRKLTPRSIFDGGRYSSLHRRAMAIAFYTPVFRRDVLWYGDVRPSVRVSVRPSVRPSVTVFRTFLLHALRN